MLLSMLLFLASLSSLPRLVVMQQTTDGSTVVSSGPVIEYSVALYIMIGIAVVYSTLTLICCVLAVLNCCKRRDLKKVSPYARYPFAQQLETILEESEAGSQSSSQVSLSKQLATSFTNQAALEKYEEETAMTTTEPESVDPDDKADRSLSFANKTALDLESGKVTEKELAGKNDTESLTLPVRGDVITTSFRKVVPMSKMNGHAESEGLKPENSPLQRYKPRCTSISPDKVKVPFSEEPAAPKEKQIPEPLKLAKASDSPHQSSSKPASPTEKLTPPSSPFSKKKHPEREIPSDAQQTDLMNYKRRKPSGGLLPDPRQRANTAMPRMVESVAISENKRRNTGSPARSRPKPMHPVRVSPKPSPKFSRARIVKDSVPSIAVHSKLTATATVTQAGTPKSSSSDRSSTSSTTPLVSAEVLLKELQAVKTKWYLIGMKLEFSQRRLNVIRLEHGAAPDKCLGLLCQEWVAASKEAATWSKVVDALRTDLVKERELANTLERGYCWLESPNSKTWL